MKISKIVFLGISLVIIILIVYLYTIFKKPPFPSDVPEEYRANWSRIVAEEEQRLEELEREMEQRMKDLESVKEKEKQRALPPTKWEDMFSFNKVFERQIASDCEFIGSESLIEECETYVKLEEITNLYTAMETSDDSYCEILTLYELKRQCIRLVAWKSENDLRKQELANIDAGIRTMSDQEYQDRDYYYSALHLYESKWCADIINDTLRNQCENIVG